MLQTSHSNTFRVLAEALPLAFAVNEVVAVVVAAAAEVPGVFAFEFEEEVVTVVMVELELLLQPFPPLPAKGEPNAVMVDESECGR